MDPIPDPSTWKFSASPEEIKAMYEKVKAEISDKDLLSFFTEEEGVPFEELLAELESQLDKPSKDAGK